MPVARNFKAVARFSHRRRSRANARAFSIKARLAVNRGETHPAVESSRERETGGGGSVCCVRPRR